MFNKKTLHLLALAATLSACAHKELQIGDCHLTREQAAQYRDIKAIQAQIDERTQVFDDQIKKGPVDLLTNKNYQELMQLKSRSDEALKGLASALKDNSVCLQTLFGPDLNFLELSDEK